MRRATYSALRRARRRAAVARRAGPIVPGLLVRVRMRTTFSRRQLPAAHLAAAGQEGAPASSGSPPCVAGIRMTLRGRARGVRSSSGARSRSPMPGAHTAGERLAGERRAHTAGERRAGGQGERRLWTTRRPLWTAQRPLWTAARNGAKPLRPTPEGLREAARDSPHRALAAPGLAWTNDQYWKSSSRYFGSGQSSSDTSVSSSSATARSAFWAGMTSLTNAAASSCTDSASWAVCCACSRA